MKLSPIHQGDQVASRRSPRSSRSRSRGRNASRSSPYGSPPRRSPRSSQPKKESKVDRDALLKEIVKASKSGRKPSFYLSSMRTRVRLISASSSGRLKLSARGMVMSFDLDQLPESDVKKIAEAVK
jgi:hypothetical protein